MVQDDRPHWEFQWALLRVGRTGRSPALDALVLGVGLANEHSRPDGNPGLFVAPLRVAFEHELVGRRPQPVPPRQRFVGLRLPYDRDLRHLEIVN